jgi:hypothetical protein
MPIVKERSNFTGRQLARTLLHSNHYNDVKDMNNFRVRGLRNAPIRIVTRADNIKPYQIYFHPHIEPRRVELYEYVYKVFEDKVAKGELEYNPFTKMIFKIGSDGYFYGVDTHQGKTLRQIIDENFVTNHDKLLKQIIELYNLFLSLGVDHGHIHAGNICLDEKGNIKLIDITKLKSFVKNRFGNRELNSQSRVLELIDILIVNKYTKDFKGPLNELSIDVRNKILQDMEYYYRSVKYVSEDKIQEMLLIFRVMFFGNDN